MFSFNKTHSDRIGLYLDEKMRYIFCGSGKKNGREMKKNKLHETQLITYSSKLRNKQKYNSKQIIQTRQFI